MATTQAGTGKTKYEMLAEAVRNTQAENKRLQRVKKDRGEKAS